MSIEAVPVYDQVENTVIHYVVRAELDVGYFIYLLSSTRYVESKITYELIWTSLQKDALQYNNISEAKIVVDEINSDIRISSTSLDSRRKWEEYDDSISIFESVGHAFCRQYWECNKRKPYL